MSDLNWVPCTIWITGLSASGKSTLGKGLNEYFKSQNVDFIWFDGEDVRARLDRKYGYSPEERAALIDKMGEMAMETQTEGKLALFTVLSHLAEARKSVRK